MATKTLSQTMGASMPKYGTPERTALAASAGIKSGYTGTAAQNAQIVASLNKSATPSGSGTTPSSSGGGSSSSIINNQSNLVQGTGSEKAKQNAAGTAIDNAVNNTGTAKFGPNGEYTYKVDSKGIPYGDPIQTSNQASPSSTPATSPATPATNPTIPEGNVKDTLGNTYFSSMPKDLTYQLPSLTNDKKWVFDSTGKPFEMDSTGKVTTNTVAEQEYNTNIQKNKDIETQNEIYEGLKANISAAHQVLVDNIKKKAQEQKTAMEDLNKKYLGSKQVAGFRTGGTEYTPEIYMGILKNEEEEGIRRIKEIDDNMTLALAEAVTAKSGKDLMLAKEKFETYSKLQKEKENAIIDQYKMYLDNQKYIADTKKALETETRAREDQAVQMLTATSDAYLAKYNSFSSQKAKDTYINSIAESTGLSTDTILSQIIKATPKTKEGKDMSETEKKSNRDNDIADAILTFREIIKKNNWIGINPEQYKIIADSLKEEYGASAVLELEKQLEEAGLSVDNG